MNRRLRQHLASTPRRPLRAGTRGQAAVIVALIVVALLAIVGLAIDGGMEAGNFRQAQNAADAAAASAARWVYEYEYTNGSAPTQAQVQAQVDSYLAKNKSTPGLAMLTYPAATGRTVDSRDLGGGPSLHYRLAAAQPSTISGSSTSNLANVTVGSNLAVAGSSTTVYAANAVANIGTNTASGLAQVASVATSTTTLGVTTTSTVTALCVNDSATTSTISPQSACPGTPTAANYGTLGNQSTSATVNAAGIPASAAQQVVLNATTSPPLNLLTTPAGNVAVTATGVAESDAVSGGATPSVKTDIAVNNLNISLPGSVTVTAPAIAYHLAITGTVGTTTNSITSGTTTTTTTTTNSTINLTGKTTCDPATLSVAILGIATGSVTLGTDCTPIASLSGSAVTSLAAAGVTLGINVLTPSSGVCPAGTSCAIHACLVQATVKVVATGITVASVCAVEADTNVTVTAGTSGSGTTYTGTTTTSGSGSTICCTVPLLPFAVTVTCHVPTQTYFLGVLGWHQTNPTATATAQILHVNDVSDAEFSASPYAVPDMGTASDGKTYSLLGGAAVGGVDLSPIGKSFYLYGGSMGTYYPGAAITAPSGWQGRVSAPSGHAVGNQLGFVTGVGGSPSHFVSGGSYYLLPIFSPITRIVEAYAVFKDTGGNWGTLIDSIPANSGPFPQGITTTSSPWFYGEQPFQAVAIKVTS